MSHTSSAKCKSECCPLLQNHLFQKKGKMEKETTDWTAAWLKLELEVLRSESLLRSWNLPSTFSLLTCWHDRVSRAEEKIHSLESFGVSALKKKVEASATRSAWWRRGQCENEGDRQSNLASNFWKWLIWFTDLAENTKPKPVKSESPSEEKDCLFCWRKSLCG